MPSQHPPGQQADPVLVEAMPLGVPVTLDRTGDEQRETEEPGPECVVHAACRTEFLGSSPSLLSPILSLLLSWHVLEVGRLSSLLSVPFRHLVKKTAHSMNTLVAGSIANI